MIDAVATMSKLLADKGNSLKAFAKSYFETTQDNVGLKDVITKLSKYLAQEDLTDVYEVAQKIVNLIEKYNENEYINFVNGNEESV